MPGTSIAVGVILAALAAVPMLRGPSIEVRVEHSEDLVPGMVTLPHGFGQEFPEAAGGRRLVGPVVNELTDAAHRRGIVPIDYTNLDRDFGRILSGLPPEEARKKMSRQTASCTPELESGSPPKPRILY